MTGSDHDDGFDETWPRALAEELTRIEMQPRPALARYERRRRGWRIGAVPAWSVAAVLVVTLVSATTLALAATGHVPIGLPGEHGSPVARAPRAASAPTPAAEQTAPGTDAQSLQPSRAAPGPYAFTWKGAPAAPQAWTPGPVDDWDLLATSDYPGDLAGTMQAAYGTDCAPPPSTHQVRALVDSAYICRDRLATAIDGGGDAPKTYGGVYFSPARLADFDDHASSITWQVSTRRLAANDRWDVWLTPFGENLVAPVAPDEMPAFAGPPRDAVHVWMDNGACPGSGQPDTLGVVNGVPIGTVFGVEVFSNYRSTKIDGPGFPPCLEASLPAGPSAGVLTGFQLDVARNHVKFWAPGASKGAPPVYADARVDLPFTQAVLQFAHHSLDPGQADTFQWSDVAVSSAVPFTMLRPGGGTSVHGRQATLALPEAAPAGAFLRFYAFGSIQVSFDGGRTFRAAAPQQVQRAASGEASYWTPVPAGTDHVVIRGTGAGGLPWWVLDVSVWAA